MPGKHTSLSSLQARKELLLAEAALQRERLRRDVELIQSGVESLGAQAKSVGAIASVAAVAVAGLFAFRRKGTPHSNGKPTFLSKLFSRARLASTLWLAVKSWNRRTHVESPD